MAGCCDCLGFFGKLPNITAVGTESFDYSCNSSGRISKVKFKSSKLDTALLEKSVKDGYGAVDDVVKGATGELISKAGAGIGSVDFVKGSIDVPIATPPAATSEVAVPTAAPEVPADVPAPEVPVDVPLPEPEPEEPVVDVPVVPDVVPAEDPPPEDAVPEPVPEDPPAEEG